MCGWPSSLAKSFRSIVVVCLQNLLLLTLSDNPCLNHHHSLQQLKYILFIHLFITNTLPNKRTLNADNSIQGRVRTKTVKNNSRKIVEKYYGKLTLDFQTNKKICDEIAVIPSKRMRNKIAGFVTHLMKRIQRGPVRGISLKLQEEERERRMDFVPEVSVLDVDQVIVDKDTNDMLKELRLTKLNTKVSNRDGRRRRRNNNRK